MTDALESWKLVFRGGFAPLFSTKGLEALAEALRTGDERLTQGSTTVPPPLLCVQSYPVESADLIGFVGAIEHGGFVCTAEEYRSRGDGAPPRTNPHAATVGEVEAFFATICDEADALLQEKAACRWLLNWWDDTPHDEVRRDLLAEVELVLATRTDRQVSA